MKRIFSLILTLMVILGLLGAKIYMEQLQQPYYYLIQMDNALKKHNLKSLRHWVDLESIAQNLVDEFFQGIVIKADSGIVKKLKSELVSALVVQMEEYVKTGQFKQIVLMDLSKEARSVLTELNLTEQEVMNFKTVRYLDIVGSTAFAGLDDASDTSDRVALELELHHVKSVWKVVKINHFKENKARLKRLLRQRNIKYDDLLVQGMKNTVLWGKFDREEVFLELSNLNDPAWPTSLVISQKQDKHLWLEMNYGKGKVPLHFDPSEAYAFENDGEMNKHYYLQAGEYDFDKDGKPEILVAVGDRKLDLVVNVFKYFSGKGHPEKNENWRLVGVFMGQDKAYINGRNIRLPYTYMKVESVFRWGGNRFTEIN